MPGFETSTRRSPGKPRRSTTAPRPSTTCRRTSSRLHSDPRFKEDVRAWGIPDLVWPRILADYTDRRGFSRITRITLSRILADYTDHIAADSRGLHGSYCCGSPRILSHGPVGAGLRAGAEGRVRRPNVSPQRRRFRASVWTSAPDPHRASRGRPDAVRLPHTWRFLPAVRCWCLEKSANVVMRLAETGASLKGTSREGPGAWPICSTDTSRTES